MIPAREQHEGEILIGCGMSIVARSQSLYSVYKPTERKENNMTESVYKVIELVGTSTESWEKAATAAIKTAAQSLRDLRIAEVVQLDMTIEDGDIQLYRAKVKVSFKYESGG
jgi:flavin-binding protein dodecin